MNNEDRLEMFKQSLPKIIKDQIKFSNQGFEILYHGVNMEHLQNIFKTKELEPRTYHRYWKDGLRRKEDNPEYETSYWKFGWCCSRDIKVAMNFGAIVFVLDKNAVKSQFDIEPLAWNFHFSSKFSHRINHKKEREEFIVSKKTNICLKEIKENNIRVQNEVDMLYECYWKMPSKTKEEKEKKEAFGKNLEDIASTQIINEQTLMETPHGKNLNLEKCMIGFYLNEHIFEIYDSEEYQKFKETLLKHPKCLGLINEKVENKKDKRLKM